MISTPATRALVIGMALGVLAAQGTACGSPKPNCGVCFGCCDATGQCQAGTTVQACGVLGGACNQCRGSLSCMLGACVPPLDAGVRCSPANCTGCCDSLGLCEAGTSMTACGRAGNLCYSCYSGSELCVQGSCITFGPGPGGGTGGGAAGGMGGGSWGPGGGAGGGAAGGVGGGLGAGGGAGGGTVPPTCRQLSYVSTATVGYAVVRLPDGGPSELASWEATAFLPGTAGTSFDLALMRRSFLTASPVTFPSYESLAADGWLSCSNCAAYAEGCNASTGCTRFYKAQSGSVYWGTGSGDETRGALSGNASYVHLVQWDCASWTGGSGCNDAPVSSGACIDVNGWVWNGCWPDGGC